MAKSKRVLLVQAQYFGGMAAIGGLGAIVGAVAQNVAMMVLGVITAGSALWARRRRRRQADEALDEG